jgi:glycine dehydrogenase subunit 2
LSKPGRSGQYLPQSDVPDRPLAELVPRGELRQELPLPELGELQVVRHFTRLSQLNYSVDTCLYPLGSCTMKYNPRVNEWAASHPGIAGLHPLQPDTTAQGALRLLKELEGLLAEVAGMDAATLQPVAGAQGELTGLLLIRAYHRARGDSARRKILVPDSAHGTNPASAARSGFDILPVPSNDRGRVDLDALKARLGPEIAGVMMTNPNTLGVFEDQIQEISAAVHEAGGLMYCDGANMNAILAQCRPGDMGFDVMHYNVHKTFSTPHGGGGPGAGPVAVRTALEPFLPYPRLVERDSVFSWDIDRPQSIGRLHAFHGNFGILVRAWAYLRRLGPEGLKGVSDGAVLNANYLRHRLAALFEVPYGPYCMHEFVASGSRVKETTGVRTLDIAKRLLDHGFYAPTIYFPLIVPEAIMVEPTETETLETMAAFADALEAILREDPEVLTTAPHTTPVGRLDETRAARQPVLNFRQQAGGA